MTHLLRRMSDEISLQHRRIQIFQQAGDGLQILGTGDNDWVRVRRSRSEGGKVVRERDDREQVRKGRGVCRIVGLFGIFEVGAVCVPAGVSRCGCARRREVTAPDGPHSHVQTGLRHLLLKPNHLPGQLLRLISESAFPSRLVDILECSRYDLGVDADDRVIRIRVVVLRGQTESGLLQPGYDVRGVCTNVASRIDLE